MMTINDESPKEAESPFALASDTTVDRNDILICSTHGNIYAIHKSDGGRIWKVRSPFGAMGGVISLFVTENDKLIVGANGKTASLDLITGQTNWINKMLGFGNEEVSIVTTPKNYPHMKKPTMPEQQHINGKEETAEEKRLVISCSRGKVMAMDIETGHTLWTYNCPGVWFNIPVAIVEPASIDKADPSLVVYIGAGQWIYCLRAMTGEVVWSSRISDSKPELNYMTLATPWSSRLAAESYSAFSQNPVAQVRSMIRHKDL